MPNSAQILRLCCDNVLCCSLVIAILARATPKPNTNILHEHITQTFTQTFGKHFGIYFLHSSANWLTRLLLISLNIYTNIKQQYDAINMYQPIVNENSQTNSDAPVGIAPACCSLKESKLFDT